MTKRQWKYEKLPLAEHILHTKHINEFDKRYSEAFLNKALQ